MANRIDGTVEDVVYSNNESGFTVLEVSSGGELLTIVGVLGGVSVGERLLLYGEYVNHPSFGPQFKASAAERILPSGAAAIEKYLGGGAIPGVGPVLAARIVRQFGEDTLEVIEKDPDALVSIKGISPKKARDISDEFIRVHSLRSVINELSALGIDLADVLTLYRAFGASAAEIVKDNPYMLCGYPTYMDFDFSDSVAKNLGFEDMDPNRLKACIIYVLQHNSGNGHTCIPAEVLIKTASAYIDVDTNTIEEQMYEAADMGLLVPVYGEWGEMMYMPSLHQAESFISERLKVLLGLKYATVFDPEKEIVKFQKKNGIVYSELQKEAIVASLCSGAVVITGGPGTGKTTALNAIIELLELAGDKVSLCAPTGRAAKRLSQLTGKEASTIHRLLEVEYQKGPEPPGFVHNESNPLKCDTVVIDEMSMVDVSLFESLLRGVKPNCKVIMVGDSDQLPAVGPGNLLRDIIDSGVVPSVKLKEIFRQAQKSRIVTGAHDIVEGRVPDLAAKDSDFFFVHSAKHRAASYISDLVARRLPAGFGFDPTADIQVLSPGRKGYHGTMALNEALRDKLNPASPEKRQATIMGRTFREGDKVMQIRNNYDLECRKEQEVTVGVFNGDIGFIEKIDRNTGVITCTFDEKSVNYTFDQSVELELAYAVTVHKSQGSEYPAVVLSLADVNPKLMYRNLLYTAVTRAKSVLIVVGDEITFKRMVENDRKTLRYTCLKRMLQS